MSIRNELLEQILAASGSGGGTNGFIDYNDTSTTTTPVVLVGNTWTVAIIKRCKA